MSMLRRWDRAVAPYLLLAVSPVVTLLAGRVLLSSLPDCGEDEPTWELRHFEIALLPGLADFLPFLWLLAGVPKVRRAAAIAGLLGSARYAITQAATLIENASSRGQSLNANCTISSFFLLVLVPTILVVWLASVLIAAVMLLRARRAPAD